MSCCFSKQLLPGNWNTNEESSCYPNSSLPGNLCSTVPYVSLHMHHAYLKISQNIWVYSNLTHRAGVAGNFFFLNPYKSVFTVTCQNYLYFGGFSSGNFRGISALKMWQILSSYPLHILTFSLLWKGFNIGQVKLGCAWNIHLKRSMQYMVHCLCFIPFCWSKAVLFLFMCM